MEIDPPTETFGMGGINNSVSICTPLAIFKEGVVGRRKKRLRVAWGVRAVGSDSLMFFAGERVLSDWLWDELAVTWRRGSKCTNDCEQSGHSNHEYWICKGAHLQRATPPPLFLFPVGPVLLLIELSLPTEHTGGHVVMRKVWGGCDCVKKHTGVGILKLWWIPRYIASNHQIRQQRRFLFFFSNWLTSSPSLLSISFIPDAHQPH